MRFVCLYTKLWLRLLQMSDFDIDVYAQKIQKKKKRAQ